MKHLWPFLLATSLGLLPMASGSAAVDEVLAADADFAARADAIGHHAAFIETLADDAVLFRPEAVRGQQWLATHEPAGGRLEWSPTAAAVGCTARLAITTGPWRYSNAQGGEPVAGHYLSVWRLDADSRWQVVLDHGVDHAADATPSQSLQAAFSQLWPAGELGRCKRRGDAGNPARTEAKLNEAVGREGLSPALRRNAVAGVVTYRDDLAPGGLSAAQADADAQFGPGTIAQAVGMVAGHGNDLAVTYGILQSFDGSRRALYVRVWSRERRRWQVAVDLHTPVPVPTADP